MACFLPFTCHKTTKSGRGVGDQRTRRHRYLAVSFIGVGSEFGVGSVPGKIRGVGFLFSSVLRALLLPLTWVCGVGVFMF